MKKNLYPVLICMVIAVMGACSSFSNRGTVEKPMIGAANTEVMSIDKVELTDSSTVLYGVIHFRPGWWVKLSSKSFITADGVEYPVESIDGIVTEEQVTTPESGVINFTMTFPAIPSDVRSIDFSEGSETPWMLWDIDLTGKADHAMYQGKVPSKLKNPISGSMPETKIVYGDSTTLNIHLLGYRPEMGNKLTWVINSIQGQTGADTPVEVDADGNATLKLSIISPSTFVPISIGNFQGVHGSVILAPGETKEIYLDVHQSGLRNMFERDQEEYNYPEGYYSVFADGAYGTNQHNGQSNYVMQFYSGEFGDYHMNGDEYTAYIIDTYKALTDSIDASKKMNEIGRQYSKACLMADLIFAASHGQEMMMRSYYHINNVPFGSGVPVDSINMELTPDNLKTIAGYIDFNNPDLLLSDKIDENLGVSKWEEAGVDPGLLKTVSLYKKAYNAADNGQLGDTDIAAQLRQLNAPMADNVEAHNAAIIARIEALGSDMVTPTPDVAPDKLFEAIVAPHKGKVVMVDFWNTWCGPCRAALAANEPEKSGDLSSDDIVWIYIADHTSPELKYLTMLKDIKGIHYRVEDDQWRALMNQFNVDGIPFYVLVDRKGNAQGRPDLRDHSEFKKAILAEVDKK